MSLTPVPAPPSVRPFALTGTDRTGAVVTVDRRSNLCLWSVGVVRPDGQTVVSTGPKPGQPANPNDDHLAGMLRAALGECGWDGGPIQASSTRTRIVLNTIGIDTDPWTAHGSTARQVEQSIPLREAEMISNLVLTTDASLRHRGTVSGSGWVMDYTGSDRPAQECPDALAGMGTEEAHRRYGSAWAEVMAIRRGIRAAVDKHPQLAQGIGRLTVRTDSKVAIAKLKSQLRGYDLGPDWAGACASTLAPLNGAHIGFEWVRGHNGDPANEAADRLAVMARRNVEFGTDEKTRHRMRLEAVAEVRQQLRVAS